MELTRVKELANWYLMKYGIASKGWIVIFNNSKRKFGWCSYTTKIISLSKPLCLLNEEKYVKNTILHEIAHALVGPSHSHNQVWKNKSIELGCDGSRCYSENVITPKGKYRYICMNCNKIINAYKKFKIGRSCGRCCPVFNTKFILKLILD